MRTTCPTTQHHNPADWNIFYTRLLLAENIKIPYFGCDGVQFDRRKCLRGRNHLHLQGQPWLHTITPQQTVTLAIPTILPVLFNVCKVVTLLHSFTRFCTQVLRYFYYQHMSLYIFFTSLNYASLPNASIINANLYCNLTSSHWPTETSWDLWENKKCTAFLVRSWLCVFKKLSLHVTETW